MSVEQVLRGGTANQGRIVRVGDTVRRPRGPWTPAVHDLLGHCRARGFDGVPRVIHLQTDAEVLEYVHGCAASDPVPDWAASDEVLHAVGALLRQFHDSVVGFDTVGRTWQRSVPARWRGEIVSHNDVHPANVVFDSGRPVSLIDFDLAAPGSRAWDLAVTACSWVPLRDASDIADERAGRQMPRFAVLLDGYGADGPLRRDSAAACRSANRWVAAIIADASRRGHPAFGRLWEAHAAAYGRADDWISEHRAQIRVAARPGRFDAGVS